MDIAPLQQTLHQFAAEKDWQPFQPKNLAMALMVEAAELAEIFQWMTPGPFRRVRLHRVLLQSDAPAFDARLSQPRTVRTSSRNLGRCQRNRQQPRPSQCRAIWTSADE